MNYICSRLDEDLQRVNYTKPEKRTQRFMKALAYNLSAAHKVLDNEQYHMYLNTLNRTMSKKGLVKIYTEATMAMAD